MDLEFRLKYLHIGFRGTKNENNYNYTKDLEAIYPLMTLRIKWHYDTTKSPNLNPIADFLQSKSDEIIVFSPWLSPFLFK